MSFMDRLKKQLGQHQDKVEKGLDKAGETADKKTQGKYTEQIRTGTEKAKQSSRRQAEGGGGTGSRDTGDTRDTGEGPG